MLYACARCTAPIILGLTANAVGAAATIIQEYVTVDTSAVTTTGAALDLSFNPGIVAGTQAATATIVQFGGGTPDPAQPASELGDVSGTLLTGLQFDNAKQLNAAFTPLVLGGSSLHFLLTLSGPAVDAPDPKASYGSEFVLGLTSTDGTTPLLTADGILATVSIGPGTKPSSVQLFSTDVTVTAPVSSASAAVPEPATGPAMWLVALCAASAYARGISTDLRRRLKFFFQ